MLQVCKNHPASDIETTIPALAVSVDEMMLTHVIPGGPASELGYTKETDVNEVGHYCRDKIQTAISAIRLGQSLASAAASSKEVNPKGE